MKTLKLFLLTFTMLFQCCKSDSNKTRLNKNEINDEIKKSIYQYSDELKGVFGEFPLNLIVDINDGHNDTLVIRLAHITPFYFDLNLVKNSLWFNEKVNGVNYYYVTNSDITTMDTTKILKLNQDNKEYDIYYYAREFTVVNSHIVKKKNIHSSKLKWFRLPIPPKPSE